ncbi:MAG: DUF561 domain-containing protein [Synechococcus sp. SB0673_bin_10]|uniref:DUF561 domain-containing protein n=1 Tax=Synechococcus sp. SB0676_bin_10 TaxID=2604869 RepID=A0A6B1F551_9SYNE|nr:DUF561 domain-containing protein [Cyanobacteria bacterium MAG IRC3_bin_20]MDE0648532.1 DUF561 domain-containing protein [Cyanobacteria bacterium MAG IRC4_bin_6]MXY18978.1 DUF561 domain-containing protein [Synechococcus sp. SB0664_bin_36]MYG37879.1 DUF561 domain-containing protein [Synechococcus sp. SB0676_bin_10]MYI72403.1 DUF561 domain-containing protein [Synechococcus sp. SB0673_bin_10]MYK06527.1 DUF561 domain-containing protein [Synechococcus sp. SB0670_bin_20]MYK86029.1 DUF561 domain-c
MTLPARLTNWLAARQGLKIIAGLQTFAPERVRPVCNAAVAGGADLVDIAADPQLVRLARSCGVTTVCVSAVEPERFPAVVAAGADLVEIGNFDCFYEQGRDFTGAEVLELTRRSRALLADVPLSVTVPHRLPLSEQQRLAEQLVAAGADLIQTEGGTSSQPRSAGIQGLIEKAVPTLAAAHAISRAVRVPVLCASGLSAVTAPMAIAAGAAAVGVGRAVNRLEDPLAMVAVVRSLRQALTASVTPSVAPTVAANPGSPIHR